MARVVANVRAKLDQSGFGEEQDPFSDQVRDKLESLFGVTESKWGLPEYTKGVFDVGKAASAIKSVLDRQLVPGGVDSARAGATPSSTLVGANPGNDDEEARADLDEMLYQAIKAKLKSHPGLNGKDFFQHGYPQKNKKGYPFQDSKSVLESLVRDLGLQPRTSKVFARFGWFSKFSEDDVAKLVPDVEKELKK